MDDTTYLREVQRAMIECEPSLESLFPPGLGILDGRPALSLRTSKLRTAEIFFRERGEGLTTSCKWNSNHLFELDTTSHQERAALLRRWMIEQVHPRALLQENPSQPCSLALAYFEQDLPLDVEFALGWESYDWFYRKYAAPRDRRLSVGMRVLLSEMRTCGYDRLFRPGSSLWTFCVSRSLQYGLRGGQPSIAMICNAEGTGFRVWSPYSELPGRPFTESPVELTQRLRAHLDRLAQEPLT